MAHAEHVLTEGSVAINGKADATEYTAHVGRLHLLQQIEVRRVLTASVRVHSLLNI